MTCDTHGKNKKNIIPTPLVRDQVTCDELAQDIAAKARMPGWWQEMRQKARECEACDSGQWAGIVSKVRALLGDFRPSPEEAKEWHIALSLDERIALAGRERQGLSCEHGAVEENRKPMRGSRRLP